MATETGPDLTQAREAIEALMDDTCTITRPSTGVGALDEETGVLGTGTAPKRVYSGRCKIAPTGALSQKLADLGDRIYTQKDYNAAIPANSPMPQVGDILRVTSSRRDPSLVNRVFQVREVFVSTFLTSRKMLVTASASG